MQVGRPDLGDPRAVIAHVNRAVVHRNFVKHGRGYDVALFHVATDLDVPMARLAVAGDLPRMAGGQPATIVGWGLTKRLALEEFPALDARPPVRARAVTVPIVDDATCVEVYRDFSPHFVVPGTDLCAGDEGHDACYGDSGGPLYSTDSEGRLVEIGLTSRGRDPRRSCSPASSPTCDECTGGSTGGRPDRAPPAPASRRTRTSPSTSRRARSSSVEPPDRHRRRPAPDPARHARVM